MIGIWHPQEAVFDEVHFGKFISGYFTGEYFFDIHPPLGKLAVAGVAKIAGFTPGFDFLKIGEEYPNHQYIWLRFLPAFFGSLLAPLIYLLTLRISRNKRAARMAGFFIMFENALLVQSKFILMDSFLLFFGFAALYFFLESNIFFPKGKWGMGSCILAAICAGLAISVKWTALSFLALMLIFSFIPLIYKISADLFAKGKKHEIEKKEIRRICGGFVFLLIIPAVLYTSFFILHFFLLQKTGPGNAYMSGRFQQSQAAHFPVRDFPANFFELNAEMFRANQRITVTHSYSSQWYTWPFMLRPVYYWNKDIADGHTMWYEKIYLIGNPFVWWISTITVIYFFVRSMWYGCKASFLWLKKIKQRNGTIDNKKPVYDVGSFFLGSAYLSNLLPFIFIGRVMFLYHYLTALVFAIIIMAVMMSMRSSPPKFVLYSLVIGTLIGFFVIFPISYGTILPGAIPWPRSIFWLKSWI